MTSSTLSPRRTLGVWRVFGSSIIAFGLLLGAQQVVIFPMLSRNLATSDFATAVLLFTVCMVIVNVIGGEAQNIALIRAADYEQGRRPWDFHLLVVIGLAVIVVAATVGLAVQLLPVGLLVQSVVFVVLSCIRTYGTAPLRSAERFDLVVVVHALYVVGVGLGLWFTIVGGPLLAAFIVGEIVSLLGLLVVLRLLRPVGLTWRPTAEFSRTSGRFVQLVLVALLMNFVSYADRLIIAPLLGAAALATYYSASALSNSMSLLTNPLANAFLARIGRAPATEESRLFRKACLYALPAVAVLFALSLAIAYAGIRLLYPHYFDAARPLLVPVAIGAAFVSAGDILRPLVMRFRPTSTYLTVNAVYAAVFLALVLLVSIPYGVVGFAWATATAKAVPFAIYFAIGRRVSRPTPLTPGELDVRTPS